MKLVGAGELKFVGGVNKMAGRSFKFAERSVGVCTSGAVSFTRLQPMNRRRLTPALALAVALACIAACGGGGKQTSAADNLPPLSPDNIRKDITGKWVEVPSADGKSEPINWIFDWSEKRQIDILDQKIEGDHATFLINMTTHTNPRSRNPRSLTGQLRVHYQLQSGLILREWEIVEVENVSFKYTKETPPPTDEKKKDEGDDDSDDARGEDAKPNTNANTANANTKPNVKVKPDANRNSPAQPMN